LDRGVEALPLWLLLSGELLLSCLSFILTYDLEFTCNFRFKLEDMGLLSVQKPASWNLTQPHIDTVGMKN